MLVAAVLGVGRAAGESGGQKASNWVSSSEGRSNKRASLPSPSFLQERRTKTKREFFLSPVCLVAPSLFHAWADKENGGFGGGQNRGILGMKKVHRFPNIKYVQVVLVQKAENYHSRSISPSIPHPSNRRACAERTGRGESKRENHPGFISFSFSFFVVWDLELGKSRFDKSRKPRKKKKPSSPVGGTQKCVIIGLGKRGKWKEEKRTRNPIMKSPHWDNCRARGKEEKSRILCWKPSETGISFWRKSGISVSGMIWGRHSLKRIEKSFFVGCRLLLSFGNFLKAFLTGKRNLTALTSFLSAFDPQNIYFFVLSHLRPLSIRQKKPTPNFSPTPISH